MPFDIDDLYRARQSLARFREKAASPHHERFSFPFFSGSYFAYRRIDVLRTVAVARAAAAGDPSYLDAGCGYGDFLSKVREFLPGAEGIEKDAGIFYGSGIAKPGYIRIADAHWIDKKYDVVFVGWMEPGQDYRSPVARSTDVIVTTLDQGISLAAEFDGHGFERVAWWRTPSWEDVNIEIMNRYYTRMPEEKRMQLSKMRGAHNLWYVYARSSKSASVRDALKRQLQAEPPNDGGYDFESVLDECGFCYLEKIEGCAEPLWQVQFDSHAFPPAK